MLGLQILQRRRQVPAHLADATLERIGCNPEPV